MSPAIDLDVKERVRAAVDIVDVAAAGWELRKSGANFVARCPWHDDRRPSLTINPARQTWRCWVCDIGGDVFSLVMRRDGLSFPEALQLLADRAGIEIQPAQRGKPVAAGSPEDRGTLLAAAAWAAKRFAENLKTDEAADVRHYLEERGITAESCEKFNIGYAPDAWQWLLDQSGREGFSTPVLEAAGLVLPRKSGSGFYDRFRNRLIFPIDDVQGRPIAFGGRVLPGDDSGAKYINSPETKLFSKSRQLYGLSVARDAITRRRECLVMEGYTDVVIAHQCGVDNAVAVLGTALGEHHVKILSRFAERVVLVLDGDAAGQRRADEVVELFVDAPVDLRVLTLPEGMDPADFLLSKGEAAFQKLAQEAPDAFDHKIERLTAGVDVTRDTHAATSAAETLLKILARKSKSALDEDLRQQQILLRLSRTFGLSQDLLTRRLESLRAAARAAARPRPIAQVKEASPSVPQVQKEPWQPVEGIDRELLELLLEDPKLVPHAIEAVDPQWMKSNTAKAVIDAYQQIELAGGSFAIENLLLAVDDPDLHSMIVKLDCRVQDRSKWQSSATTEERLTRILDAYRQAEWHRSTEQQLAKLESQSCDAQEELEFLQQLIATQRHRQGVDLPDQ